LLHGPEQKPAHYGIIKRKRRCVKIKSYIKKIVQLQESGHITAREMAEMATQKYEELLMRGQLLTEVEKTLLPLGFQLQEKSGKTKFVKI